MTRRVRFLADNGREVEIISWPGNTQGKVNCHCTISLEFRPYELLNARWPQVGEVVTIDLYSSVGLYAKISEITHTDFEVVNQGKLMIYVGVKVQNPRLFEWVYNGDAE